MGIRSEESIALGIIADKLQSLDDTMQKIEKDLHSIDISLGKNAAQNDKNELKNGLNDLKNPEFKVEKTNFYTGDGVYETRTDTKMSWDEHFSRKSNECESEISKYQEQMVQKVISDMHAYMNKEENDENRS